MSASALAFSSSGGIAESPYGIELVEHDGFFFDNILVEGLTKMYSHFKAREDDVFVCSGMKTGTTWLKSIIACIMSESKGSVLKGKNAHELIPIMERSYNSRAKPTAPAVIAQKPSPRILGTHLPYSALPPQIKSLGCRMIYIARNPKDTFVSHWKFLPAFQNVLNAQKTSPVSKDVFFDSFCNGVSFCGPFADHVLGFWNASRNQSNILFLTYEDMMDDPLSHIRKISDFLGRSSLTEEDARFIDSQCSFQSLSNIVVDTDGTQNFKDPYRDMFRKGKVGDWKNHFTPEMSRRMDLAVENRFQESGLFLKYEL